MHNMSTSDNPDKDVMRNRIGEVLSRLLSRKYDANVKIKFKTKEEIEAEKKNKK